MEQFIKILAIFGCIFCLSKQSFADREDRLLRMHNVRAQTCLLLATTQLASCAVGNSLGRGGSIITSAAAGYIAANITYEIICKARWKFLGGQYFRLNVDGAEMNSAGISYIAGLSAMAGPVPSSLIMGFVGWVLAEEAVDWEFGNWPPAETTISYLQRLWDDFVLRY